MLYKHSRRKNRSVKAALNGDTWINDLAHGNTNDILPEFLALRRWLCGRQILLDDQRLDLI